MPSKRSISLSRLRLALLLGTIAASLCSGDAAAQTLGTPIGLETEAPWSPRPSGFHLSDPSILSPAGAPPGSQQFRLAPQTLSTWSPAARPSSWGPELAPTVASHSRPDRSRLVAGGFTVLFLGLEYAAFWSSAKLNDSFALANEGWFDPDTYAGGADKGSHLIGGYIAGRVLESALLWGGSRPEKAQLLSAVMIGVTGTLIEVGDAYHGFGFSWQDALLTAAGGVAGSVLAHYKLDDTITMRLGKVGVDVPNDPSIVIAESNHYSGEMYTVDLRMSGFLRRLGRSPGAARFFLASLTYGSKGYPWVEAPYRQRRVGFEVGLDTYEIGLALGIRPDSWWGGPTLAILRYLRLPFTGIGFQYELNSRKFMGPNSFYSYDR